jgi:hypothetical protein
LEIEDLDAYEEVDAKVEQISKCIRDLIVIEQILDGNYSIAAYHEKISQTIGDDHNNEVVWLRQTADAMLLKIKKRVGSMPANE